MERALEVCRQHEEGDKKGESIRVMCPLNSEGMCLLYTHRPMICRLHGISHELRRPGRDIGFSPGCGEFSEFTIGKDYFTFDRTPFYIKMAGLEKEVNETFGPRDKIKLTVAQMISEFESAGRRNP